RLRRKQSRRRPRRFGAGRAAIDDTDGMPASRELVGECEPDDAATDDQDVGRPFRAAHVRATAFARTGGSYARGSGRGRACLRVILIPIRERSRILKMKLALPTLFLCAVALLASVLAPAQTAGKGKKKMTPAPRDYANTLATLQTDMGDITIKFFY